MRSKPTHQLFFIFQLENIFRANLSFSTSYGRLTDFKSFLGLLLVRFLWLGEKNSLKYLLNGGGRFSRHVQTVSTSLMSKLVNRTLCHTSRTFVVFANKLEPSFRSVKKWITLELKLSNFSYPKRIGEAFLNPGMSDLRTLSIWLISPSLTPVD